MIAAIQNFVIVHDGLACDINGALAHQPRLQPD
jgi:hypothetical protein